MDVARKALILSREIGYELEMSNSRPEALISKACAQADSVEEAMKFLADDDAKWAERLRRLNKEKKTLRYIANISEGKIKIAVEEIGQGPSLLQSVRSGQYCRHLFGTISH